jgi:hypothetical protein
MSLYVSSHYKNSPNDLQLLSDAPAHRLYVLLGPSAGEGEEGGEGGAGAGLPDVLVVIQVCYEGQISRESVRAALGRGGMCCRCGCLIFVFGFVQCRLPCRHGPFIGSHHVMSPHAHGLNGQRQMLAVHTADHGHRYVGLHLQSHHGLQALQAAI